MTTRTLEKQNPSISTVEALSDWGFTAAQILRAIRVFVTAHDGDLIYCVNGDTPTATNGHVIKQETTAEIVENPSGLKMVAQSGTVVTTVELETYV